MANATFIIPATVRIVDLPFANALTGAEILEAVQTVGGVGNSVQFPVSAILTSTFGALPTSGGTGQFLQKTGPLNFSATWANISSSVLASTGLAQSGSTTVSLSLASHVGLSVLGVGGTSSAVPAPIVGTADQVMIVNHAGSSALFGAVNLGAPAAITGTLSSTYIASQAIGTQQLVTAAGLSVLAVNSSGTQAFSVVTGAAGNVLGVTPSGSGIAFQGGMTLLNTLTPSGVTSVTDTTSLTSTYRTYMITLDNVVPSTTANTGLTMAMATNGSNFIFANYVSGVSVVSNGAFAIDNFTGSLLLCGSRLTTNVGVGTTYGVSGSVQIYNPSSSLARKHISGNVVYLNGTASGTASICAANSYGYYDGTTSPVTGVEFAFGNAGTIITGTIKIYGMT